MINDRDDHEGHDEGEGEYHFSDDSMSYETEPEPEAHKETTPTSSTDLKETLIAKFKEHRRVIIFIAVFIVIVFVVYKVLQPSPNVAVPFAQQTAATAKPPVAATPAAQQPVAQPQPAVAPPLPTPTPAATQATAQQFPQPAVIPIPLPSPMPPAAAVPAATPQTSGTTIPPAAAEKSPMDRLTAVEQQTASVVNSIQTEILPKINDNAAQSAALQNKIQEINTRVSGIETSINNLIQLLQATNKPPIAVSGTRRVATFVPPAPARAVPPPVAPEPKVTYTVQAIIPGRAWLKSENGDTVTVAEGDTIKGYGRVVKIDPYDGVVSIDVGNRLVTLSYGANGD